MRDAAAWAIAWGLLALGCGSGAAPNEPEATLTLLHSSDIHSRLWPFRARLSAFEAEHGLGAAGTLSEVGGVSRLATLLERERARSRPSLWLDSGDALEGAPIFQRSGGRVEFELLGSLGLAAMALGNHELSLPAPALAELLASSPFPVLAANLPPSPASPLEGRLASSAVLELGGRRIAVIGVANPGSPPGVDQRPQNDWGLAPTRSVAAAVQLAVDDLAPRTSLVIVLSHWGLEQDHALVRSTSGIGVVLGGHQHVLTPEPEWEDDCSVASVVDARGCSPRRVPIVHSGAYAQWLTRVELRLAPPRRGGQPPEPLAATFTALPVNEDVPESPAALAILDAQRLPPEPPIGVLTTALSRRSALGGDSALGDVTADAVRLRGGADVALLNSSGLRDDLEAGVLLRSDLELAFPFAEPWRLISTSGRVLRRGLTTAARRSATRGCESTLQVSGLRLRVRCAACSAGSADCVDVEQETALGYHSLGDEQRLLLLLPSYLTLPGADFEEAGAAGSELELSVPDAIAELLRRQPADDELEACVSSLASWSPRRCAQAFGEPLCPLAGRRAQAVCAELPRLESSGDGRIQMQP